MVYNFHYDIAGLLLALTMIVHFLNRKKIMTPQTKFFMWMLWFNLFSCILDIITIVIERVEPPVWFGYFSNMLYLMVFNTLPAMYFMYIIISVGKRTSLRLFGKIAVFAPLVVSYLLLITTPVTKWAFSYDAVSRYVHGPAFDLLYAIGFLYILMSLIVSIRYHKILTYGQKWTVLFYNLACVMAMVVQFCFPENLLMQYAVSLSLLLAYLTLEIPKDDEDYSLGIYSRSGFVKQINTAITADKKFRILGLNLVGFNAARETYGVEKSLAMVKQIVDSLLLKIRPMQMFIVKPGQLALYTDDLSVNLDHIIEKIRAEFQGTIEYAGHEVEMTAGMYQLDYPENVKNLEDILDIVDFSLTLSNTIDTDIVHASEEIFQKRRRENHIDQLLQSAVRENRLEVYYQPIYSVREKCYRSAEALLRLRDEKGNFISPDEFIPLAERTGRIIEIGEFVFRSVCEMFTKEKLWEKGIEYIEINLSVVQCMQGSLHEKLSAIMKEYEISPKYINLEITESATVASKEVLSLTMERLIEQGVTFSLDDYGTGYSNIANVMRYPFFMIKVDKSVIWYAMENERAMRALRHTIAMLKDIDLHIVAEGVETAEQAELLAEMGCDYFQGFYFSKPVPLAEFLSCLAA